jgi:hypothetical protein
MFGPDGDNPERPSIEEMYESATNTSSLKHYADRRSAADVLRDVAMSASELGSALRWLLSEWSAAAKPKRAAEDQVKAIADRLRREDAQARMRWGPPDPGAQRPGDVMTRARAEAAKWHRNELRILASRLKSRQAVWEKLSPWLAQEGIEPRAAAAVLLHWLDPKCPLCHGQKWQAIHGTPGLSSRTCPPPANGGCGGTGEARVPHGQDGRKLENHLDQCAHLSTHTLKTRRKALASIPPIDRLSKRMQPGNDED